MTKRQGRADVVVLDVGGVLVDWDPRHLYRNLFLDEQEMDRFLSEVCSPEWHRQHDLGMPFDRTAPPLIAAHPGFEPEIRAWGERFAEMYRGPIVENVEVFQSLRASGVPTYAATNFAADGWVLALERWEFLAYFDGALVSGEAGVAKPDPAFFALLAERFALEPGSTLFVDDSAANVAAAIEAGFLARLLVPGSDLRCHCQAVGLAV